MKIRHNAMAEGGWVWRWRVSVAVKRESSRLKLAMMAVARTGPDLGEGTGFRQKGEEGGDLAAVAAAGTSVDQRLCWWKGNSTTEEMRGWGDGVGSSNWSRYWRWGKNELQWRRHPR
jgi:hypothetical protein